MFRTTACFASLILTLTACRIAEIDAKLAAASRVRETVTLEHGGSVVIYTLHLDRTRRCLKRERRIRQALHAGSSTDWTTDDRANIEAPISSSDTFAGYERVVTRLGHLDATGTGGRYTVTTDFFLVHPQPNPTHCSETR